MVEIPEEEKCKRGKGKDLDLGGLWILLQLHIQLDEVGKEEDQKAYPRGVVK